MDHIAFRHLSNKRGGFDSVCLRCFATVAVGIYGSELTRADGRHLCSKKQINDVNLWLDKLSLGLPRSERQAPQKLR